MTAGAEHQLSIRTFLLGGDGTDDATDDDATDDDATEDDATEDDATDDDATDDDATRLSRALAQSGMSGVAVAAVGRLSRAAAGELGEQLSGAVEPLLELDLGDILVLGWRKHRVVREAAQRTAVAPGSTEKVYLAAHQITSTHSPMVDLLVDGARLHRFVFELTVIADLSAAVLQIEAGRLTEAGCGKVALTAELCLKGKTDPLLRRRAEFDFSPPLRLGSGIPLVSTGQPPAGNASRSSSR